MLRTLSGTCVKRKLWIREESEELAQEKRDCPARKEEDDFGSTLSEARLCVNVWLAFGRQPWQIALLGWQPGSLSTRSSHLTVATHRDCTLYSPPPLVLLHSTSSSSFSTRQKTRRNSRAGWMDERGFAPREGGPFLKSNRSTQARSREPTRQDHLHIWSNTILFIY